MIHHMAYLGLRGLNIFIIFCRELRSGIPVTDEDGNRLGVSKVTRLVLLTAK